MAGRVPVPRQIAVKKSIRQIAHCHARRGHVPPYRLAFVEHDGGGVQLVGATGHQPQLRPRLLHRSHFPNAARQGPAPDRCRSPPPRRPVRHTRGLHLGQRIGHVARTGPLGRQRGADRRSSSRTGRASTATPAARSRQDASQNRGEDQRGGARLGITRVCSAGHYGDAGARTGHRRPTPCFGAGFTVKQGIPAPVIPLWKGC